MFRKLYNKTIELAGHKSSKLFLGCISFIESFIFPIPPDVIIIPMTIAKPKKWIRIALIATIGSLLGAILGYYIGVQAENFIMPLLINLGYEAKFETAQIYFQTYGIYIILIAGFSPIPYKLFTISAGMMSMSLFPFFVFSLIARGSRYFLISFIIRKFGKMADAWLNKYIDWLGYLLIIAVALFLWYGH